MKLYTSTDSGAWPVMKTALEDMASQCDEDSRAKRNIDHFITRVETRGYFKRQDAIVRLEAGILAVETEERNERERQRQKEAASA